MRGLNVHDAPFCKRARNALGDAGLEAARDGDLAALKACVASGWDPHRACDRHGSGPLLWAAGGGHLACCNFLAEHCGVATVTMAGPSAKRRRNALHWAARNGHLDVVKWLVRDMRVPVDIGETSERNEVLGASSLCLLLLN